MIFSINSYGQQKNIFSAHIQDYSGKPIENANIIFPQITLSETSDSDGKFTVSIPKEFQKINIEITHVNFKKISRKININQEYVFKMKNKVLKTLEVEYKDPGSSPTELLPTLDAANMALIEAGLNIAAGQSPDALSNIATGATAGVKGYTERLKDADAAEKEVLALDLAIGQAERAERAAAVNFGIKSIEAERATAQKLALLQQKAQLKAYYDSITILPETRRKIMLDLNNEGAIDAIKERLKDSLGENRVGSDIYNQMLAQETEALVQQRALPMATNTAPEGMKQAGVTPDGRIVYEDADGKRYVGG